MGCGMWDVESPKIFVGSFRANKNGCRVSGAKMERMVIGVKEARTRGLKEGRDGQ